MRPRNLRALLSCAVASAALVVVSSPQVTAVAPEDISGCPWVNDAEHALYGWVGGTNGNVWGFGSNWTSTPRTNHGPVPNDDRQGGTTPGADENEPGEVADNHDTYVCIPPGSTVIIHRDTTRFAFVQAIWVGENSTVSVTKGAGLFVQSERPDEYSFFRSGSHLNVTAGWLGGRGTLKSQGQIEVRAPLNGGGASALSTRVASNETSAHLGELIVGNIATMTLPERGVGLRYGYDLTVEGTLRLARDAASDAPGDGFIAAAWGTRTEITSTGTLDIAADGGYYQGTKPDNVNELSDLVNGGLLKKSAGSGTSVIDADYQGAGTIRVDSGTLALPDGTVSGANRPTAGAVAAAAGPGAKTADLGLGATLATGRCAGAVSPDGTSCSATVDPLVDPLSVSMRAPSGMGLKGVTVEEQPSSTDIHFAHPSPVVRADADDFVTAGGVHTTPTRTDPARVEIRYALTDFPPGTDLDDVDIVRSPLVGNARTVLHNCSVDGQVDDGVSACIDRTASAARTAAADPAKNLVIVVNIVDTQDSRYINRIIGTPIWVDAQIAGQANVGETLTATTVFDPEPQTVDYTWLADNVEIAGSHNQTSITLKPAQLGKIVKLVITVQAGDWSTGSLTLSKGPVQQSVLTTGSAATAAQPQVGVSTTAQPPTDWPTDTTFTYAWQIGGVRTVTGATYAPLPEDDGRVVTLVTTGTAPGYFPAERTRDVGAVKKGVLTTGSAATSGQPQVGTSITAQPPTDWPVGTTFAYAWQVVGVRLVTGATYTPLPEEVGRTVILVTTGTAPGYEPADRSQNVGAVQKGVLTTGSPAASSQPQVDVPTTAVPPTDWPAGTMFTYEWRVNGRTVAGPTYLAGFADADQAVTLVTTGTAPGYEPAERQQGVGPVLKGAPPSGQVKLTSHKLRVKAKTSLWPAGTKFRYKWFLAGDKIKGQGSTLVLKKSQHGKVKVEVTASLDGYQPRTVTKGGVTV